MTDLSSPVENTLAARTLRRVSAAVDTQAIACLPEIVKLMRTLSHKSGDVSIPELADVIQKDPVILAKVIGAANKLGYNSSGVSVTTVFQAIHIIGYEKIRSLAMSLLLVEQSNRSRSVEEQREVAALALTSGCIAHSAAAQRTEINSDEAFVCASLRSFGRIVMVSCMIDDYREAQDLAGVIDVICRGLVAPECLLFSRQPSHTDFDLVHGSGRAYAQLHRRVHIRANDRTVFGVCLSRGENVLIHRAADPKIAPYLPAWLPRPEILGSFVLLPLTTHGQRHGVILVGWPTTRQIMLTPEEVRQIRVLLALLWPGDEAAAA